jgi:glycosyltransferase involved in cell wall biosynthesis
VRILLDYRPALRQRTGVGEYTHELARALVHTPAGAAETLTLFSASWKDRLDPHVVPGALTVDRRIPNRLLNYAWHRLEWPSVERIAAQRFDVVQAFHPLLIPARQAAQVVTIHDLDFLDYPERTSREIRRDYPALTERHAHRADHIVVNSQTTSALVQARLGVPAERVSVCPPGAPDWTARRDEPRDGCVLFLGTLDARKNVGVLLDAYERLLKRRPDAPPLVLAGGTTSSSKAVVERATMRPLAGRVELTGYVEPSAREQLYRRAHVFVMPSFNEGFGMPVLEAMTVGVPVVVADRGALPEVTGEAGLRFEPDDPEGLAAILEDLLGSASRRQAHREAGWTQARRFEWRASAATLRQAWTMAIEHRRSRRG